MAAWDPGPPRSADPSLISPPQGDLVLRKFFSEANFPTLDKTQSPVYCPFTQGQEERGGAVTSPSLFPTIPTMGRTAMADPSPPPQLALPCGSSFSPPLLVVNYPADTFKQLKVNILHGLNEVVTEKTWKGCAVPRRTAGTTARPAAGGI